MEIRTRLEGKPEIKPLYKYTELSIPIPNDRRGELLYQGSEEEFYPDAEYEIIIRKARKKRSLDANAYAWVLMSKLAIKLRTTPVEVYRQLVAESGYYFIFPVEEAIVETFREVWSQNGQAWMTEDMGACRGNPGYRNVKCFYGSSSYDKEKMSAFIDLVIDACHEQGIPTATPQEVEQLKGAWR